jgi:hypothetical protein
MIDEIRRIPGDELDEQCGEGWERVTDEPDIRGVSAYMITLGESPYWSVSVAVAEFVRDDPLETDLRGQMPAVLRAVDGAANVWEEDREAWGVAGTPSGRALVRAAAGVVDRLAVQTRGRVEALHLRWPEF